MFRQSPQPGQRSGEEESIDPGRAQAAQREPVNSAGTRKKCWICFEEELCVTQDQLSQWKRPCACSLEAHEYCLVSWVNFSKRSECPQCGTRYQIVTPAPGIPLTLMWLGESYTLVMGSLFTFSTVMLQSIQWLAKYGHVASVFVGATRYNPQYFRPFSVSTVPPFFSDFYDLKSALVPFCLVESKLTNRNMFWTVIVPLLIEAKDWSPRSPATATAVLPFLRKGYYSIFRRYAGELEHGWDLELGRGYAYDVMLRPLLRPRRERERLRWLPIDIDIIAPGQVNAEVRFGGAQEDRPAHDAEEAENAAEGEQNAPAEGQEAFADDPEAGRLLRSIVLGGLEGMRNVMAALMFPLLCGVAGESLSGVRAFRRLRLTKYHWSILGGCGIVISKDAIRLAYKYVQVRHKRTKHIKNFNE